MPKKAKAQIEESLEKKLWSSNGKWNNEGSFFTDTRKDLKADFVFANPPFNDSEWSG